jgi:hypothetical protein
MGRKERISFQRKLEGLTGCVFGGILEIAGGISPTLYPSRLGMDPTFTFGMSCGAEKWFLSLHSQNFIG